MADLKRWFKVWTSVLDDPHFQELSLEDIGRWALLGAMLASVGSKGRLRSPAGARRLREVLRFDTIDALRMGLQRLPNVLVEEGKNRHAELCVTMAKWQKYQRDSTQAERAKTSRAKRRGDETRREETRREETNPLPPPRPEEPRPGGTWGTPENLVALYNAEAPDNVAAVEVLSPKRRDKIRRALRQYAEQSWWREVFVQYQRSRFLRGLTKPTEGHASFRPDFDWLLSTGKNGVENYVRVHDGMYAD